MEKEALGELSYAFELSRFSNISILAYDPDADPRIGEQLQESLWAFKHSHILEIHQSLNFKGSFFLPWNGESCVQWRG